MGGPSMSGPALGGPSGANSLLGGNSSVGGTSPLGGNSALPSRPGSSSLGGSTSPAASVSPAESGQPFRATLTNAAINSVRAERQRTVIPPRPANTSRPSGPADPAAAPTSRGTGPTDFSLPMPAARPETPEPGSRANWPLVNNAGDAAVSAPPADNRLNAEGRVRPPWQDMPKEPPALRLVESQLGGLDSTVPDLPAVTEPPPLRVIDGNGGRPRRTNGVSPAASSGTTLTALDRSTTPPVPEGNDGDLLIFAQARSAWFTGHSEEEKTPSLEWANPNDLGWRAAEKAATPEVVAETSAGLPKRVPQANLVPGSPMRDERPLRIVRDAASIAAHTTGYFRGWRRGQEIGGFAMGGRPGREAAGGWDFTRDGQPADDYRDNAGYSTR
jgi:hypothetical protein